MTTIPLSGALPGGFIGGMAMSAIAEAVAALYGAGTKIGAFLDRHLEEMQSSANTTVATTGRILERAKLGFGIGYLSSVIVIAVGQFLLGNTWAAISTVATAATVSNPIAMTCAAVGAVLYGWQALSDTERNAVLDKLGKGLEIGVEFIRSVINFVVQTGKELLNAKVLKEFKAYIAEKAGLFGRSLSDVTQLTVDLISDAAGSVKTHAELALAGTIKVAGETSERVGDAFSDIGKAAGQAMDRTGEAAKQALESGKDAIRRGRRNPPSD